MATHAPQQGGAAPQAGNYAQQGYAQQTAHSRPRSTETKASFKTTEFFAYVAVLAGILLAGLIVSDDNSSDFGARSVWLYATILTVGYMISRGLAKSGSREPRDHDNH